MNYEKIAREISRCRLVIGGVSEFDEISVVRILKRVFEPTRQMLHDFHATDATIAIQEREEIKQQRDALLATGGIVSADRVPQMAPLPGTHHNALMYGKKCKELRDKLAKATAGMKEASKLLRGSLGTPLSARIVLSGALKEINDE